MPYCSSCVCAVDGVLLAIGGAKGQSGSEKTSAIYALHPIDKRWQHIGELPFGCSSVDTLLLSEGRLLIVDGDSQRVLRVSVEGRSYCSNDLCICICCFLGLAALFPDER